MEIKLLTESFRWSGGGGGGGTEVLRNYIDRYNRRSFSLVAGCFEVWNFPFQEFSWVGNLVSFFGSFTYVGMYLKVAVATLQRRACTCQVRSSRIPDDEKINSYGTILNKQPLTFNFLFFLSYII